MQGIRRKIVYVSLYELFAIAASSAGLALLSDSGLGHASVAAVAASAIAVVWNLAYNTLFERWEARQATKGRGVARRIAHALGFEAGLVFMLDLGLIVFFLVYTYVFNLGFDRVFGLPASAAPQPAPGG